MKKLHLAYADSPDGKVNFSKQKENRAYVGTLLSASPEQLATNPNLSTLNDPLGTKVFRGQNLVADGFLDRGWTPFGGSTVENLKDGDGYRVITTGGTSGAKGILTLLTNSNLEIGETYTLIVKVKNNLETTARLALNALGNIYINGSEENTFVISSVVNGVTHIQINPALGRGVNPGENDLVDLTILGLQVYKGEPKELVIASKNIVPMSSITTFSSFSGSSVTQEFLGDRWRITTTGGASTVKAQRNIIVNTRLELIPQTFSIDVTNHLETPMVMHSGAIGSMRVEGLETKRVVTTGVPSGDSHMFVSLRTTDASQNVDVTIRNVKVEYGSDGVYTPAPEDNHPNHLYTGFLGEGQSLTATVWESQDGEVYEKKTINYTATEDGEVTVYYPSPSAFYKQADVYKGSLEREWQPSPEDFQAYLDDPASYLWIKNDIYPKRPEIYPVFLNSFEMRTKPPIIIGWERTEGLGKPAKLLVTSSLGPKKNDRIIHDKKEYIAQGVEEIKGRELTVEVYAEESIVELKGKTIIDRRPETLLDALNWIVEDTRWTIGSYPSVIAKTLYFYKISSYDALMMVLDAYGLELETEYIIAGRTIERKINLVHRIGRDAGRRTTFNTDLTEVSRIVHDDPIITKFYGYGKGELLENGEYGRRIDIASVNGGLEYLDDNSAREIYGIGKDRMHYEYVEIYSDIETPEELLAQMQSDFEILKTPKITYEGSIADLGLYDDKIGDSITILDDELGIAVKGRITQLVTTPRQKVATLGNLLPTLSGDIERIKAIEQTIRDIDTLRDTLVNLGNKDYLDGIIDRINAELNTVSGFASLVPGRGIIIPNAADESEATRIIELGGGFWRIASSRDQFGNWEYRTIADGRGIIATEIVAGILKGGQVQFNLEAGTFLIGSPTNPSFYWNGSDLFIDGRNIDLSANSAITSRVTSEQLSAAVSGLASKGYVDGAIEAINRANPNLVTNRSDRWEQGDIVSGVLTPSANHIRTQSYFPIRAGSVTVKVNPLYQAKITVFDTNYNFVTEHGYATEQTFNLSANQFFKASLKRVGDEAITPTAIDTAELKTENAAEATQWTPYFGDLTLEEQQEFFHVVLESNNGWTVDTPDFTAELKATLYLFNEDVTGRYASNILWYRQYAGGPKTVIGSGQTYTVTADQIDKSATYEVAFEITANIFYLATDTGDILMTDDNELLIADGLEDAIISIKASKVLVRDYAERITTAESSIIQLADSITSKVEQTTYDGAMNTINTNISTLTQKATSLEANFNGAKHTLSATGYEFRDSSNNIIFSLTKGIANEQNKGDHDDCASGFPLVIPIHIGESTASIEQVLIKWRTAPFRTNAKGAASGGGGTTASGGGHTSGIGGSIGAVYTGPAWDWSQASGHFHQVPSTVGHSHWVNNHIHNVSAHIHDLIFGVNETPVTSNAITIWIDGVQRASVDAQQGVTDLTAFLQTKGWHTVEFRTTTLKRIYGDIFIKSYIRR